MITGDYSMHGYLGVICVEHKRWGDLVRCCSTSSAWKKFREGQLTRLAAVPYSVILVNGNLDNPIPIYSSCRKETIVGRVSKILVEFGIPVLFASNEHLASQICENYILNAANHIERHGL